MLKIVNTLLLEYVAITLWWIVNCLALWTNIAV